MLLSTAIRKGAESTAPLARQLFRGVFVDNQAQITHTCVLGAAFIGALGAPSSVDCTTNWALHDLDALYPELTRPLSSYQPWPWPFPQGADRSRTDLSSALVYANDALGKSREEIADWLESVGL